MRNSEYFNKQCEILEYLLLRKDKNHSAVKTIIRCATREAINFVTDLPGYDNKLGSKLISNKAYSQILHGNKSGLIGEHVVPVSITLTALNKLTNINVDTISIAIQKYATKAVITKEEDNQLKRCGLQKQMPENWCGKDILARYKYAKIEVIEKPYQEVLKMPRK